MPGCRVRKSEASIDAMSMARWALGRLLPLHACAAFVSHTFTRTLVHNRVASRSRRHRRGARGDLALSFG